uniref:(northern house mosquito) hypothetical protein n=1 Tax=Culex pipiens TaxID=7175 RepID=A0A8D8HBI6_CULPI
MMRNWKSFFCTNLCDSFPSTLTHSANRALNFSRSSCSIFSSRTTFFRGFSGVSGRDTSCFSTWRERQASFSQLVLTTRSRYPRRTATCPGNRPFSLGNELSSLSVMLLNAT